MNCDCQLLRVCVCCWDTDLPRAETLEEEVESEAPNHGSEQDAHQRQTLDPLAASQLGKSWEIQIEKEFPLWFYINKERECKERGTFMMM